MANQMRIKQKSLFDHLAEDIKTLESTAQEIKSTTLYQHNRVQKTFVISRRSLSSLDEISKIFIIYVGYYFFNGILNDRKNSHITPSSNSYNP